MKEAKSFRLDKFLPHVAAIIVFYAITLIYFYPFLEGKKINASDTVQGKGMNKEIVDYRVKTGKEPLWTNSMFGGMPAYQISTFYKANLMRYVDKVIRFGLWSPIGLVITYFLGFYLLLLILRINPWLSMAGAIAFAFSSYFFIILEAGHNSKAAAIGYMAPVLAGIILTYRGKLISGGILTAFFLALQILAGHPQITYYLLIMVLIYGIFELVRHFREKALPDFAKATSVLVVAAILAVLTNAASLWGTYEYSKYTIRSKSELTSNKENQTTGLDKDYATAWSYGIPETMTLLIPNFQGGSSHGSLSEDSKTYEILKENRVPNADQIIKQLPLYWGPQSSTSGPVYVGAIIFFFFIFSLFILKGSFKWWALAVTILSILLSWGKHFMPLTSFFLDYFPLYNKFRTVSMTLVMAELTIPLLAILALDQILKEGNGRKKIITSLQYSAMITGGILLFFILFAGSLFSYTSVTDAQIGYPDWLMDAIRADRLSIFRSDALRSLIFVLLVFGLTWGYLAGKVKKTYVLILIPALILIDLWPVNKRYLNNDDFSRKSAVENPFPATKADQTILKDKDLYYRVYNMTEAFDVSARTSFFHKNIGGYHGAKFRRYQELIDFQLSAERNKLVETLKNNPTINSVASTLVGLGVFNMLNTRYFIINNDREPIVNPYALGNAWFVKNYLIVKNADEEMKALTDLAPDSLAVVDQRFKSLIGNFSPAQTTGQIKLASYQPNKLTYEYSSNSEQMAIFSDIYYDKGWNAYIDGKKTPHFRADFILRAMILPAGDHKLEFRFEPRSYYTGQKISLIASILLILSVIAVIIYPLIKRRVSE